MIGMSTLRVFLTSISLGLLLLTLPTQAVGIQEDAAPETVPTYVDLRPIFRAHCEGCHNTNDPKGGFDLSRFDAIEAGSTNGPVVEPGEPEESWLYLLVSHQEEPTMPPDSDPIPNDEIELIRRWIAAGLPETSADVELTAAPMVESKPRTLPPAVAAVLGPKSTAAPTTATKPPLTSAATPNALRRPLTTLDINPSGPQVALPGRMNVVLADLNTLEPVASLPFPEGDPYVIRFADQGDRLLAGGGIPADSGRVVIWDLDSRKRLIEVGDKSDAVIAADLSSDGRLVALSSTDRVAEVYDAVTGAPRGTLRGHPDWVTSIAFSPESLLLATGDRNGGISVWVAETLEPFDSFDAHDGPITSLDWQSDGDLLGSASDDGHVILWDLHTGSIAHEWVAHESGVRAVRFLSDGRLITGGRDGTVKLWSEDGTDLRTLGEFEDEIVAAAIGNGGNTLVVGDWTSQIQTRRLDGTELASLSPPPIVDVIRNESEAKPEVPLVALAMPDPAPVPPVASNAATPPTLEAKVDQLADQVRRMSETLARIEAQRGQIDDRSQRRQTNRATSAERIRELDELVTLSRVLADRLRSFDGGVSADPGIREATLQLDELSRMLRSKRREARSDQRRD